MPSLGDAVSWRTREMPKAITDQFVEILAAVRVKHVYGIVGDSLNGLTDGMRRSVSLRR